MKLRSNPSEKTSKRKSKKYTILTHDNTKKNKIKRLNKEKIFTVNSDCKKTANGIFYKKNTNKGKATVIRIYSDESDEDNNETNEANGKKNMTLFSEKLISTFEKNFFLKFEKVISSKGKSKADSIKGLNMYNRKKSQMGSQDDSKKSHSEYTELDQFIEKKNRFKRMINRQLKSKNIVSGPSNQKQKQIMTSFAKRKFPLNFKKKNELKSNQNNSLLPQLVKSKTIIKSNLDESLDQHHHYNNQKRYSLLQWNNNRQLKMVKILNQIIERCVKI